MTHFATILRVSEGIAFWQSVAIMDAQYDSMRALGEEVYHLLKDGDVAAASVIYEPKGVQLRRDIASAAASNSIGLRNRVKKIALAVRLGK